jgi:hypothetical protein
MATLLGISEQESVMKALYLLLKEYDEEIQFESLSVDDESKALFSRTGAVYLDKNILGGFRALVPFSINYRGIPVSDEDRIKMIDYLSDFGKWLTETDYPALTDDRIIEKIDMVSPSFLESANASGTFTYTQIYTLTYRKE